MRKNIACFYSDRCEYLLKVIHIRGYQKNLSSQMPSVGKRMLLSLFRKIDSMELIRVFVDIASVY